MLSRNDLSKVFAVLLTIVLFAQPAQAYAWEREQGRNSDSNWGRDQEWNRGRDWDGHWGRGREWERGRANHPHYYVRQNQPHYGQVVLALPHGIISVVIGGERYHYCDGVYYQRVAARYVVVASPYRNQYRNESRGDQVYFER